MTVYSANFLTFASSKFGVMLLLAFLLLLGVLEVFYRERVAVGKFFARLVDRNDTLSMTNFQLLFTVVISNCCFWPLWVLLCIMDNVDNTANIPFTMIDIPNGVIMVYFAANGLALAAKGWQQKVEAGKNGDNDSATK